MDQIEETRQEEEFVVDNDKKAEYCIRKIKAEQAEHDRLMELVNAEIEELNLKALELDNKLESETKYLKSLLYGYFQTVAHKETKTQESYKLLSGSLVYKKPAVTIVRPDDEKLVAYLENAGREDMVETKKTAKWGEVKKTLTISYDGQVISEDGEILDFIATEEKAGEFNVK